jgi:hypothetical protein
MLFFYDVFLEIFLHFFFEGFSEESKDKEYNSSAKGIIMIPEGAI